MRHILLLVLASTPLSAAEPEARWPRNADDVELTLNVIEALEEGPLILEFCLKNVSKEYLKISYGLRYEIVCDWPLRGIKFERERFIGSGYSSSRYLVLAPNDQLRFVYRVQHTYLHIPAGKGEIQYRWEFQSADDKRPDTPLFTIQKKQTLTILPVTTANIEATIRRFRQMSKNDRDRVSYIRSCRHPEFAPLFAEVIADSAQEGGAFAHGQFNKPASLLVGEIYDIFSSVEEGFQFLKTHLSGPAPFPNAIFIAWQQQSADYERNLRTFDDVQLDRAKVFYDRLRKQRPRKHGLMHWERPWPSEDAVDHATHVRHKDWRLTAAQFMELLTIPNPAVRIELCARYPEQCPPEWVQTLVADIANIGKPPTTFAELLAKLDHPRFAIREEASATLLEYAPAFAKELDAVEESTLSEEARARLATVRTGMKTFKAPPYWEATLRQMMRQQTPHTVALTKAFKELERPSYVRTLFSDMNRPTEFHRSRR